MKSFSKARSLTCQYEQFKRFLHVRKLQQVHLNMCGSACSISYTDTMDPLYLEVKQAVLQYQAAKSVVFSFWTQWLHTPRNLLEFKINE